MNKNIKDPYNELENAIKELLTYRKDHHGTGSSFSVEYEKGHNKAIEQILYIITTLK